MADAGYRSDDNFEQCAGLPTELVVALGREGKRQAQINPHTHSHTAAMATKLQADEGKGPIDIESGLPSRLTAGSRACSESVSSAFEACTTCKPSSSSCAWR